jgi:hypothetical protein
MKASSKLASAFALCAILALAAFALPPVIVTHAAATANPQHYVGTCPGVIHFRGAITVRRPTTVRYRWTRSDGATAPIQSLTFTAPGTKTVADTWTLGGASLPHYSGWEAVSVLVPNALTSNHANFTLRCR